MVRVLSSLFTVAAAATIAGPLALNAPADVYFGPFKYSAISTRTKIDALGRAYRERWETDGSLLHDAGMVESSLFDWAKRYPQDKWLAPTAFHLAQLYMEIQTPEARAKAKAMFEYVAQTFPKSKQAHLARLRLQQGFPPLHDESPVAPTPSPYGNGAAASPGAASPMPPGEPGGTVTPAPSATAAAASPPAAASPASSSPPRAVSPAPSAAPAQPGGSPKPVPTPPTRPAARA